MTASPSQAPDQTEQPNGKTLSPHLAELAKNY